MRRVGVAFVLGCGLACGATTPNGPAPDAGPVADSAPGEALTDWLSVSDVAIYQGPKAPIYTSGAPLAVATMAIPVIALRPGVVRVYLHPLIAHKPHHIFAELHVQSGGKEVFVGKDDGFISADSSEDETSSTFNFQLDASIVKIDTTYTVLLTDQTAIPKGATMAPPQAVLNLPADGTTLPLLADATAPDVKIVYIPVQYDFDGSHRLPDTSDAQLGRFHDSLYRTYPAATITATVGAPLPLSTQLLPNETGWDALIQDLQDRRASDNPDDDVYYVGLFQTTGTFDEYCSSSCVGGIGLLPAAFDFAERVAIVADYPGDFTIATMDQELAHDFGRLHADCGNPSGVDPKFPYADGKTGSWGWDVLNPTTMFNDAWIDPTGGTSKTCLGKPGVCSDIMSYCQPVFVSDYTYAALYKQMKNVKKTKRQQPSMLPPAPPQRMHAIRVLADGTTRDAGTIRVPATPAVDTKRFDLQDKTGKTLVSSDRYYNFDELGGGLVMVPENAPVSAVVRAALSSH